MCLHSLLVRLIRILQVPMFSLPSSSTTTCSLSSAATPTTSSSSSSTTTSREGDNVVRVSNVRVLKGMTTVFDLFRRVMFCSARRSLFIYLITHSQETIMEQIILQYFYNLFYIIFRELSTRILWIGSFASTIIECHSEVLWRLLFLAAVAATMSLRLLSNNDYHNFDDVISSIYLSKFSDVSERLPNKLPIHYIWIMIMMTVALADRHDDHVSECSWWYSYGSINPWRHHESCDINNNNNAVLGCIH